MEAVSILKSRPAPGDHEWGRSPLNASCLLGAELWARGRLEEAAAAHEAGLEAERISGVWPKDAGPHVHLLLVYVAMGKFKEVIEMGKATLPLIDPPADPRGHEREAMMIAMHVPFNRANLFGALAEAYEGLGDQHMCAHFHNAAIALCRGPNMGMMPISVLARCSRLLEE